MGFFFKFLLFVNFFFFLFGFFFFLGGGGLAGLLIVGITLRSQSYGHSSDNSENMRGNNSIAQ